MLDVKKTHTEVKNPQIDVRFLADYMAASEQAKRTIIQGCKYRPIARVLQHDEAKAVIAKAFVNGELTSEHLLAEADWIANKLASDPFEKKKNEINADYLKRFAKVLEKLVFPNADVLPPGPPRALNLNGVKVAFSPQLLLRRVNRNNKLKAGALMLRYSKGKPLPQLTAEYQSAAIFGCLCALGDDAGSEPEKLLCLTLDGHSGAAYSAPGKAVYIFNEMKAVCQGIAERWPAIKPPKGAVL